MVKKKSKSFAIETFALVALILGSVSLVLFWIPFFGLLLAIMGLIFGILGINKNKKDVTSKGLAIGGVVLSGIVVLLQLFVIGFYLFAILFSGAAPLINNYCHESENGTIICDDLFINFNESENGFDFQASSISKSNNSNPFNIDVSIN